MPDPTILVVDDEEAEREILATYLSLGGYKVHTANNGAEALNLLKEHTPHAILLDVQMPVMDGFQTIEKLKEDKATASIPVIFLTSMDRSTLKIRGLEMGALHYVTKPYNRAVLLATVKSVLRNNTPRESFNMEGSLEDLPLPELLQSLDMGKKPAWITLLEDDASLTLRGGELTGVTFRGHKGEDAFLRLLFFGRGRYGVRFNPPEEDPASSPHAPLLLMPLLMDSTRIYDELQGNLARLGPLNTKVSFQDTPETPKELLTHSHSTMEQALNLLQMGLAKSVDTLLGLLQSGALLKED